jgi:hypothetical protein
MLLASPFSSSWARSTRSIIQQDNAITTAQTDTDDHNPASLANADAGPSGSGLITCPECIAELAPDFRPQWHPPPYTCCESLPQSSASQTSLSQNVTMPPTRAYFFRRSQSLMSSRPRLWAHPAPERTVRESSELNEYTLFQPIYTGRGCQTESIFPLPSRPDPSTTVQQDNAAPRPTHRPENAISKDPPPPYQRLDTMHSSGDARRTQRPVMQVLREVDWTLPIRIGQGVIRCMEEWPAAVRDAQQVSRVARAKKKIFWLEKHGFMSAQERLLTREITRGDRVV